MLPSLFVIMQANYRSSSTLQSKQMTTKHAQSVLQTALFASAGKKKEQSLQNFEKSVSDNNLLLHPREAVILVTTTCWFFWFCQGSCIFDLCDHPNAPLPQTLSQHLRSGSEDVKIAPTTVMIRSPWSFSRLNLMRIILSWGIFLKTRESCTTRVGRRGHSARPNSSDCESDQATSEMISLLLPSWS